MKEDFTKVSNDEAKDRFMHLLTEKQVNPKDSWRKILEKIRDYEEFKLIKSL